MPTLSGDANHKDSLLETIGCGCAFFDYDNAGWLDTFLLSGTRLSHDPEGRTNRLFKSNRDGTLSDVDRTNQLMLGYGRAKAT